MPNGPWILMVHENSDPGYFQWTYHELGSESGAFLTNKLRDDDSYIQEGLAIVYSDDSFMKEAGGAIARAPNVACVKLRFNPHYYMDPKIRMPHHRFFKEFISEIVQSPTLKRLHLDIPFLYSQDERHLVAAFGRCRLSVLSIDTIMSHVFWARMVEMSRCHAGDLKVQTKHSACAAYVDAINENLEGRFEQRTLLDVITNYRPLEIFDGNRVPSSVTYHKDHPKGYYSWVTLNYQALFSFDRIPAAHMAPPLACAAERMRMKTVDYKHTDRTLILRGCELKKGRLPDLTLFGHGLRRLRVIDCGLIG